MHLCRNKFGTARLRDAFKEQQLCIGELRRLIETDANHLLEQGSLSAEASSFTRDKDMYCT